MSQTEIVNAANAEATRLIDTAHAEADRLRGECDIYVDNKLAQFEDYLNGTLRSVSRGRHQLRTAAGTHDYVQHQPLLRSGHGRPGSGGGEDCGNAAQSAVAVGARHLRLGRRPGTMTTIRETVPSPSRMGLDPIAIQPGAEVDLDLRLESVSEGVLVTGTVHAPHPWRCARCLTR